MYSGKAMIASLRRAVFPACCQTCRLMRSNCLMKTCTTPAYYNSSINNGYHTVTKRHYDHKRRTNPDVVPSAIHNVQSIKAKWTEKFTDMNISEPDVSAELIIAHVLGQKTVSMFTSHLCMLRVFTGNLTQPFFSLLKFGHMLSGLSCPFLPILLSYVY